MRRHVSTQCTNPRLERNRCKLLEYEEANCKMKTVRKESHHVKLVDTQGDSNDCYFIDCGVNGHPSKAYVDSECAVVTIRKNEAIQFGFSLAQSATSLRGYGGSGIHVLGETRAKLSVDLVETEVVMLVVDDAAQMVPLLVGKPFLNQANVVFVLKNEKLRLFDTALAAIPLWAREATVIRQTQ